MSVTPEKYLKREQNFLDQPPFNHLELVARERHFELRRLKLLLPLVHRFEQKVGLAGVPDQEAKQIMEQAATKAMLKERVEEAARMQITGRVKDSSHQPLPQFYIWQATFAEMTFHFKDYLYWYEYFKQYTAPNQPWRPTGEPSRNIKWWSGLEYPTYYQYLVEKDVQQEEQIARDARIRRLAILQVLTETFPQDFSTETALQPPSIGEERKQGKRWQELVNAGLKDERRQTGRHV